MNFQKSKKNVPHLEISVQVGCGMMCDYCPQVEYIKRYKTLFGKIDKLSYDIFLTMIDNIPIETVIHWTGFTEPLDCLDFPLIVKHLHERGHVQLISTTLYGKNSNQQFFVDNITMFNGGVSLHLPDNSDLMKGKFDNNYINYVDSVFKHLVNIRDISYSLFLIGSQFHAGIQSLIDRYSDQLDSERIITAKYLNTRNDIINPMDYNLRNSSSSISERGSFYCAYRRLNQGVLLPNGTVVLCCQDYNIALLRMIVRWLMILFRVIFIHVQNVSTIRVWNMM